MCVKYLLGFGLDILDNFICNPNRNPYKTFIARPILQMRILRAREISYFLKVTGIKK